MAGYAKLFSHILQSTIWHEDDHTRIVWITLLALKDQHGNVLASLPGLAHSAHVPIESAQKALKKFLEPDEYSRTRDYDGRRLQIIDGGWHVLNHEKYRKMLTEEERREQKRKWWRENRGKKDTLDTPLDTLAETSQTSTSEADQRQIRSEVETNHKTTLLTGVSENDEVKQLKRPKEPSAEEIYQAYPRKEGKGAALKAILNVLKAGTICATDLLATVKIFAKSKAGQAGQFCPHPATWFNQKRFEDNQDEWNRDRGNTRPNAVNTIHGGSTTTIAKSKVDAARAAAAARRSGSNGSEHNGNSSGVERSAGSDAQVVDRNGNVPY